jgi:hypothetical protein
MKGFKEDRLREEVVRLPAPPRSSLAGYYSPSRLLKKALDRSQRHLLRLATCWFHVQPIAKSDRFRHRNTFFSNLLEDRLSRIENNLLSRVIRAAGLFALHRYRRLGSGYCIPHSTGFTLRSAGRIPQEAHTPRGLKAGKEPSHPGSGTNTKRYRGRDSRSSAC